MESNYFPKSELNNLKISKKWSEIPNAIYCALETKSMIGNIGLSYFAKLENEIGKQLNVWLLHREQGMMLKILDNHVSFNTMTFYLIQEILIIFIIVIPIS